MIGVFHAAQIPAETVFVQLFMGLFIPQAAGVRRDLIGQHNGAVCQAAEFQLEVHQIDADLFHKALQQVIHLESVLFDGLDLLRCGQLQRQGVIAVHEGIAQVVILVGELDGGLLKDDAFLHPVVLGKMAGRDVADDDLQGNNGHFFHHGLSLVELLDKVGWHAPVLQHLHE